MKKIDYFKIPEIIIRKLYQDVSNHEQQILDQWFSESDDNVQLFKKLENREKLPSKFNEYNNIKDNVAWQKINAKLQQSHKHNIRSLLSNILKYAAVIIAPLMIAVFLYYQYDINREYTLAEIILEENPLNLQEATLVLDDGRLLNLTKVHADTLAKLSGAQIIKKSNTINYQGKIVGDNIIESRLNTLIVPKSRVQKIVLSDGSKIWVNAASYLQYPVLFSGETRKITLVGEAYFEIVKNKDMPFIVSTNGMKVEVLGTEFNISSYKSDESIATTLVEGSVKIKVGLKEIILEPNEQVELNRKKGSIVKKKVDTKLYTSWKDGKYIFDYENLENVMKKLSRWYNVEVFYDNESAKGYHFTGTLNKYDDIKKTLHIIELATKIKFEITDKTILIKDKSKINKR